MLHVQQLYAIRTRLQVPNVPAKMIPVGRTGFKWLYFDMPHDAWTAGAEF
jgi:hypothetical protein